MREFFCHARVEVKDAPDGTSGRFIEGYASTKDLDRDADVIPPDAFAKTIETFLKNPVVFYNHMWGEPIATVEKLGIDEKGLFVRIKFAEGTDLAEKVWLLVKQGALRALSFGFRILAYEDHRDDKTVPYNRIIKDLDLYEVSVVTVPANAQAVFSLAKGLRYGTDLITPGGQDSNMAALLQATENLATSVKSLLQVVPSLQDGAEEEKEKGATSFADLPMAGMEMSWKASSAVKTVQKWASSDGSGDKDKINWSKYAKAFLWFDSNDAENFGAYKLPFCQVMDGKLTAIPRGVMAAAGVMRGARGGVNIPDGDVPKVKAHIEKYYKKMGKDSPFAQRSFDVDAEEFGFVPLAIRGLEDTEPNNGTPLPGEDEEKRGRVISAANLAKLKKCLQHIENSMGQATSGHGIVKELIKMCETPIGDDDESASAGDTPADAGTEGKGETTEDGSTPGSTSQSQPGEEDSGASEQKEQLGEQARLAITDIQESLKAINDTLDLRVTEGEQDA